MRTVELKKSAGRLDQTDTIEVYSFIDENVAGTFSNNLYGKNIVFENLMSLILLIEDCMNTISFPRPMVSLRKMNLTSDFGLKKFSFKKNSYRDLTDICVPEAQRPSDWPEKPAAVFSVRIVFRTLSGWQGEAVNAGTEKNIIFKSDLELIMFILNETKNGFMLF